MNDTDLQMYSCADGSGLSSTSVTTDYWDSSNGETKIAAHVTAAITLCFMLVGLPSNLLLIVSILWQRLYTQPTYILLLNLAIVDFLLCLLMLPFIVVSGFAGEFNFGNSDIVRCKICQFGIILAALLLLTIHILSLLSVDRLIFIKYPMKYHKIVTACRVHVIMISLWLSSIFFSSFPLFGFGDLAYSPNVAICIVKFTGETKLARNIYYPVFLAIICLVSISVLFSSNIWIGCIVQKHLKKIYNIKKNLYGNENEFVRQIKGKYTKTKHLKQLQFIKVFGAIFIANIITWIPLIVRVFYSVVTDSNTSTALQILVYVSVISVVVVHPVIQACLIPELRKLFIHFTTYLYCCCFESKPAEIRKTSRKSDAEDSRASFRISDVEETNRKNDENLKCCKCNCLLFFSLSFLPALDELSVERSV